MLTPQAQGGTLTTYTWKPAPFISCTNCATPVVTPQYTTRYELLAKNENFCTDTAIAVVRTHIAKEVFIPDAFTPNKDQLNDVLYVLAGPDAITVKDFNIFNRWGQKIFQVQNSVPNNPAFGWNGKVNGTDAATGTYVYFVTMAFADGSQQTYKGTIVLIR
jgi:gliding motility-associated-like protein